MTTGQHLGEGLGHTGEGRMPCGKRRRKLAHLGERVRRGRRSDALSPAATTAWTVHRMRNRCRASLGPLEPTTWRPANPEVGSRSRHCGEYLA